MALLERRERHQMTARGRPPRMSVVGIGGAVLCAYSVQWTHGPASTSQRVDLQHCGAVGIVQEFFDLRGSFSTCLDVQRGAASVTAVAGTAQRPRLLVWFNRPIRPPRGPAEPSRGATGPRASHTRRCPTATEKLRQSSKEARHGSVEGVTGTLRVRSDRLHSRTISNRRKITVLS